MALVDEASPRVKMLPIGESPMGLPMYVVFLSSEKNIENLEGLQKINKELALNPNLPQDSLDTYLEKGKVFIMATLSMHSTEVGPSQSAPIVAHEIATTNDPQLLEWLDNVVYMMVPCHNPDGMDLVVNHFNNTKGTKYEGGSLPVVYHKYVGHDNNRDFITLTQSDNRAVARLYNQSWFPQVMVEKHQMGSYGPRYFVPPNHDPIAENIDEKIWNWTWIFGSNMAKDMTRDGLAGVSQHYLFDEYWPGATETCLWKNVIGLLTECASVQFAKPIYVEKSELRTIGKGMGEYKKSINMPLPWEGGWWKLGDIVDYELSSTWSLIKTASIHRKDILVNRNALCVDEVNKGRNQAPYFYVFPYKQHDPGELVKLLELLHEHGVKVYQANNTLEVQGKLLKEGDYVVPLAQPFRAFIKEVLEKQKFPERHYTPEGELIKPYDITSWSLPLHRGVNCFPVTQKGELHERGCTLVQFPIKKELGEHGNLTYMVLPAKWNDSYKMVFEALKNGLDVKRAVEPMELTGLSVQKGDFIIKFNKKDTKLWHKMVKATKVVPPSTNEDILLGLEDIKMPKIALVETNFHDMDAGWTRYVLDTYGIPFTVLKPGGVKEKDLTGFDVIVFPDNNKSILLEGKYKSGSGAYSIPNYDPQFTKGIGKDGLQKLMGFVDEGGNIVSWGQSAQLFFGAQSIKISEKEKEEFQLPVRDISDGLRKAKLYAPGTLLKINLKQGHPVTYGMPPSANVFTRGRPVFATSIPYFDTDRRVIGSYPEKEDIFVSGYADNVALLEGKAAIVWAKKREGAVCVFWILSTV